MFLQSPLPLKLTNHAVVALADGQTGLLCGGYDGTAYQTACYYYSSSADAWTAAPGLNVPRIGLMMQLYKGKIYAYGGGGSDGTPLSSVEVLVTAGKYWQVMPFTMCQGLSGGTEEM